MWPTWKPRTRTGYRALVRNHIVPKLGHHQLRRLRPQHVQTFLNERAAGRRANTVRNIRACLREALGQALAWGLVDRNVADGSFNLKVPKTARPARESSPLRPEETLQILDAAARPPGPSSYRRQPRVAWDRFRNLWPVLLAQGLRLSEAAALRWDNVDFDSGRLRIEWTLYRPPANEREPGAPLWQLEPPKSLQSRLSLELAPEARAALLAQRDKQAFERRTLGEAYPNHGAGGFVFADEAGEPFAIKAAVYDWHQLLKRAGVNGHRIHDIRHTYGTYSIAADVPERVLQANLGHANPSTTKVYTHVVEDMQKAAASKFTGFLRQHGIGAASS
jgi:integrase